MKQINKIILKLRTHKIRKKERAPILLPTYWYTNLLGTYCILFSTSEKLQIQPTDTLNQEKTVVACISCILKLI